MFFFFAVSKDLVGQTTSLQESGNTLEQREELVKEFLKRYKLSPEQSEALESKPIGKCKIEIKIFFNLSFSASGKNNFLSQNHRIKCNVTLFLQQWDFHSN